MSPQGLNGLTGDSVLSRTWCKFADRQDHPEAAAEEIELTKLATGALFRAAVETVRGILIDSCMHGFEYLLDRVLSCRLGQRLRCCLRP